jgi:NAD(P)-dependent dehydrogenase (short-subunit alcohol dehydrogenase family)
MTGRLPPPFRLDGKVVVITGSAGLLGRNHAAAILEAGGCPVLLDVATDRLHDVTRELESEHGSPILALTVDITDEDQVRACAGLIWNHYGRLDGLVNNAANNPKFEDGAKDFSRLECFPLPAWHADIAVGLTGSFLCSKHLGPLIHQTVARSEAGVTGSIVNVSSDLGLIAPDQRLYRQKGLSEDEQPVKPVTYSVVKAGLIGLTRYLATYWPGTVRSNAICPGGVEQGQPADFLAMISDRIPMGRMARPDEYRGALVFLLSEASSYVNGAVMAIDGGRSAW